MKDRINRLARGVFDEDPELIITSETNISMIVSADTVLTGKVCLKSGNNMVLRGIIYSTDDRVTFRENTFIGQDVQLEYEADTKGLLKGEVIKGCFNIVSNGGEQQIRYEFTTTDNKIDSTLGNIKNVFHFTNLAQSDIEEARRIFVSESFEDVIIKNDYELKNKYELLAASSNIDNAIEEFLNAVNKKQYITISLSKQEDLYENLPESFRDNVIITKSTWGSIQIHVSCDNDMVELSSNTINDDDFAGNSCEFHYIIRKEKLHGGMNYAVITFETPRQTIEYRITVKENPKNVSESVEEKKALISLFRKYIDFRLRKITMQQWSGVSLELVQSLRQKREDSIFYKLFQAQILIVLQEREEAEVLLEEAREALAEKKTPEEYCYYLYVSSLYRQDKDYAANAAGIVKNYYEEGNYSWKILWTLFYLDASYEKNKSMRLARIKEAFYKGEKSPVLYLEAFLVFTEVPALLRVLDAFELQVIIFACKNNMMNEKLAVHIGDIVEANRNYSDTYLKMLMRLYNAYGSVNLLEAICSILVNSSRFTGEYFVWYEEAVLKDIRITRLYEYYLMAADKKSMKRLPRQILLYFAYNNNMDYVNKAYLYANIIINSGQLKDTYELYREQMEEFALEQASLGRMNDNLAVVYEEFLEPFMISDKNADNMAKVYFAYKVECENRQMKRVYVKYKETKEVIGSDIRGGVAYVPIYTSRYALVFEDEEGNRYQGGIKYQTGRVIKNKNFVAKLYEYGTDNKWIQLHYCENASLYNMGRYETINNYKKLLAFDDLDGSFRREKLLEIINYYHDEYDGDNFKEEFVTIDESMLMYTDKIKLAETFIINGHYEEAFEFLRDFYVTGLNPKSALRLADRMCETVKEYDRLLLDLCVYAFRNNKSCIETLTYLSRFYNGSTKEMLAIWQMARKKEAKTYDLEERILAQILFTRVYTPQLYEVFEVYYNNRGSERVIEACLAYYSYHSFVNGMIVNEDLMRVIESRIAYGIDDVLIQRLALVRWYSEADVLDKQQKKLAKKIIYELCQEGIYFPFFKKFTEMFMLPFNICDKTLVEYKSKPKSHVTIHYILENGNAAASYQVEAMKEMYEGVYVAEFVLFYGDSVSYYIKENRGDTECVTESSRLVNDEVIAVKGEGRYEMINDILASRQLNDMKTMDRLIRGYQIHEKIADTVFKPL